MPRPDRHNEIEVNLLTAGSLTYLFGGHRTTIEAGKLAVFWAAIPHQIVAFDGDEPYFVVTLPLSEFLRAGLELNVVNRILQGEILMDSVTHVCDQLKFKQWERELRESDPACERAARLEVQARLLRFAHEISNRPTVRYPAPTLSRADQTRLLHRSELPGAAHVAVDCRSQRSASELRDEPFSSGVRHHDDDASSRSIASRTPSGCWSPPMMPSWT